MNKGFSLVELIVVIAIMAILVGIAVPVYTGYISKAEESVEAQYVDELERAIETVLIDIKAGLSVSTDVAKISSVKIAKDGNIFIDGSETAAPSNNVFVDLLDNIVTIRKDAAADYEFTLSEDGMTVTNVTNDPRDKGVNTDEGDKK